MFSSRGFNKNRITINEYNMFRSTLMFNDLS